MKIQVLFKNKAVVGCKKKKKFGSNESPRLKSSLQSEKECRYERVIKYNTITAIIIIINSTITCSILSYLVATISFTSAGISNPAGLT